MQNELEQAENSIYIAVAWLANSVLFDLLVEKAREGITVQLLVSNDDINRNSDIQFDSLKIEGSIAYLIIGDRNKYLTHNKSCTIGNLLVITGYYN